MSDKDQDTLTLLAGYDDFLSEIKGRIQAAQIRAALSISRELTLLYWQIGRTILERQAQHGWGAKVVKQLAADLKAAFPGVEGFSRTNLLYMRAFAEAYPEASIVQQLLDDSPMAVPPHCGTVPKSPRIPTTLLSHMAVSRSRLRSRLESVQRPHYGERQPRIALEPLFPPSA